MSLSDEKKNWAKWLERYGAERFFESFLANAQDAESTCIYCHQPIYLDIVEGGGVPDWGTRDRDGFGDYGCPDSPDTNITDTGGHMPTRKTLHKLRKGR